MYFHEAEHEKMRRRLWCDVAAAVASSWNCHDKPVPGKWADAVLADFDERFPKPAQESGSTP